MILGALERVELQPAQVGLGAVEEAAAVRHLLEEERVGAVQDRHVDLPPGEQRLEIVQQVRVAAEREGWIVQQQPEVDVASLVDHPGDRRAELEQQADAVASGHFRAIDGGHGVDYTGPPSSHPGSRGSPALPASRGGR